jgi:hypothetical protein
MTKPPPSCSPLRRVPPVARAFLCWLDRSPLGPRLPPTAHAPIGRLTGAESTSLRQGTPRQRIPPDQPFLACLVDRLPTDYCLPTVLHRPLASPGGNASTCRTPDPIGCPDHPNVAPLFKLDLVSTAHPLTGIFLIDSKPSRPSVFPFLHHHRQLTQATASPRMQVLEELPIKAQLVVPTAPPPHHRSSAAPMPHRYQTHPLSERCHRPASFPRIDVIVVPNSLSCAGAQPRP